MEFGQLKRLLAMGTHDTHVNGAFVVLPTTSLSCLCFSQKKRRLGASVFHTIAFKYAGAAGHGELDPGFIPDRIDSIKNVSPVNII